MRLIKRIANILAVLSISAALQSAPAHADDGIGWVKHSPWLALRFEQNEKYVPLRQTETLKTQVALERTPFTIVMPVRGDDDVYHITAWTDDSIFAAAEASKRAVVRDRGKYDPPQYFAPYTSMADTAAGSGTLMLNAEAHHYLSGLKLGPDHWRHTFYVSSLLGRDDAGERKKFAISQADGPLFLTVWFDEDGDEKMSHGEYEFLVLRFK